MRKLFIALIFSVFLLLPLVGCQQNNQIETQQYILQSKNTIIAVAKDEKTFDAAFAAINADNKSMLSELIRYGEIFAVNSGTKVEIIETVGKRSKIRIMDGDIAGKVGWVQTAYVQKT